RRPAAARRCAPSPGTGATPRSATVTTGAPAVSTTAITACASRVSRHRRRRCAPPTGGPSRTAGRLKLFIMGVRPPAVAGRFYPGNAAELRAEVTRCLGGAASGGGHNHHGVVAPHAGYVYSGTVAGKVFANSA